MISHPKFGSYTPMFRIPDMIDKLFSALDGKVDRFLKLTDCLLILSCVHKRFILFIRPDLFFVSSKGSGGAQRF